MTPKPNSLPEPYKNPTTKAGREVNELLKALELSEAKLEIACEFISLMQEGSYHVPADEAMRQISELGEK